MYRIGVSKIGHGKDAHRIEAFGHARANPPDLDHWQAAQHMVAGSLRYSIPDAHSPKLFDLLGRFIRQFRQGLRISDSNTHLQAGVTQVLSLYLVAQGLTHV